MASSPIGTNHPAIKTGIIADLRLLYHKLCDFAEKCKKTLAISSKIVYNFRNTRRKTGLFVHSPAGKLPAGNEFLPGFLSSPDRNFTEQGKERLNHI